MPTDIVTQKAPASQPAGRLPMPKGKSFLCDKTATNAFPVALIKTGSAL
jgi:hypothetical protein